MTDPLFHVSPTHGLTLLEPRETAYFNKPRQVCLATLEPMALLYGVKHFEYTYGYTKAGELYYEEYFPNALEEIYRGKSASLYRCAWREGMQTTAIPNEVVSVEPVPVEEELVIPDVYEALLAWERRGGLRIIRWPEVDERGRAWIVRSEAEVIETLTDLNSPMARYLREKYPESWALAQSKRSGGTET